MAQTYWRWRLTWRPSHLSAGLERGRPLPDDRPGLRRGAGHCIRDHIDRPRRGRGCWLNGSTAASSPATPSSWQRSISTARSRRCWASARRLPAEDGHRHHHPSLRQRPGRRLCPPGFRLDAGERCGDHDAAAYLAGANAMARHFRRWRPLPILPPEPICRAGNPASACY